MLEEYIRARNLDDMMGLFEESESWTYSAGWMDCYSTGKSMGRGFVLRGEHATLHDVRHDADIMEDPLTLKPN